MVCKRLIDYNTLSDIYKVYCTLSGYFLAFGKYRRVGAIDAQGGFESRKTNF